MLRAARVALGLSQAELAIRAGVSRQTIVRLEAGGKGVALDVVDRVRAALERAGIIFLPASSEHGPAVAVRRPRRSAS
ncbi:helix-turn-helix transcriptional regulator [Nitratireductor sp. CH_MIT9313-5]|uniref:helix-turn-helix transcriptional regulator n=1 Tax=Nitratireductor sp. CH_MIT9313-5 TaxID=3107764 RepID=UPI00300838DE